MKKQLKFVSLDAMIDKHIGEIGTVRRDSFENELKIELQGQIIKKLDKNIHCLRQWFYERLNSFNQIIRDYKQNRLLLFYLHDTVFLVKKHPFSLP